MSQTRDFPSRREFLKQGTAAAATFFIVSRFVLGAGATRRRATSS